MLLLVNHLKPNVDVMVYTTPRPFKFPYGICQLLPPNTVICTRMSVMCTRLSEEVASLLKDEALVVVGGRADGVGTYGYGC
jgi:hypothetical protein